MYILCQCTLAAGVAERQEARRSRQSSTYSGIASEESRGSSSRNISWFLQPATQMARRAGYTSLRLLK